MLRSRRGLGSLKDVDAYVKNMEKLARNNLDNCLRPFEINTENDLVHFINGDPEWSIVDFITKDDFDLIVMGTLGRTGISGFLIGNAAERIVNGIQCSLLAVKPDGFVSPITA